MTTTIQLMEQEALRSTVYRRLADTFRQPVAAFADTLGELETALQRLDSDGHEASVELQIEFANIEKISCLEVDFTRLFTGPFLVLAPPYGSIYLEDERRMMGASTVDVQGHYRSLGFDLAPDFKEAPDHIVAELEFMHVLICREVEAFKRGDRGLLQDTLQRQQLFLIRHMGAWVPEFTAKVIEHTTTAFYRHLATMTRRFIGEEVDTLSSLNISIEASLVAQHV